MSRELTIVLAGLVLAACAGAPTHEGAGPPPRSHPKIVGEPVPESLGEVRTSEFLRWRAASIAITGEYWSGNDVASGRIVSLAPHPLEPGIVYAASASGGLWKTENAGGSWRPLTDELPTLNHGCVVLDPQTPDTVYLGTGEYTLRTRGDGLFRSLDGGSTWERLASVQDVGTACSRIFIDPEDPSRIHVTGNSGYARSTDGGANWSRPLIGPASDLAVDPLDPSSVYVAIEALGIFRSSDGGESFARLESGLPVWGFSRVLLALAPSAPSQIYAAFARQGELLGLYRSLDGGERWARLAATPNFPSPQAEFSMFLTVDPRDAETIYAGGVYPAYAVAGVVKSTDGGASWADVTCPEGCSDGYADGGNSPHPDMHAMAFGADGALWLGTDGGVWTSDDDAATWRGVNATLGTAQTYSVAIDPSNSSSVMAATQDNGTVAGEIGDSGWLQLVPGDGGPLFFDLEDPSVRYGTHSGLNVYRVIDGELANITGPWRRDRRDFMPPLIMHPSDPDVLLAGTDRVWRTSDASSSASWRPVSGRGVSDEGTLTALAVGGGSREVIYAGNSSGRVYVGGAGALWLERSRGLSGAAIGGIEVDPDDPSHALAVSYSSKMARLVETFDEGRTWLDVGTRLPAGVVARALAVDWRPGQPTLFVGSGAGVYWSMDGGRSWTKDGADLPNVNITDLVVDADSQSLLAATWGRGVWIADLPASRATGAGDGR